MKKFLVTFCSVTLAVGALWLIRGVGSGATEKKPPSREMQIAKANKEWSKARQIELDSPKLLRRFAELIDAKSGLKHEQQRRELAAFVELWIDYLKSGTYESFLRFRQPDNCRHSSNCMGLLKEHVLKGSAAELGSLSNEALSRMHFDAVVKWKFHSVPTNSILFTMDRVTTTNRLMNAERAAYFVSYSPIRGIVDLTFNSPFSYRIRPEDVFAEYGEVQIALVSLAMLTKDLSIGTPVYQTAFWSPRESRWKALECWATTFDFRTNTMIYPGIYY